MRRRVVITGIGVVSSAGSTCDSFFETVSRGIPSFSAINRSHLSHLRATQAGIIPEFDYKQTVEHPSLELLDRFVHLATVASHQALAQAGIVPAQFSHRMGLICATCSGPMQTIEEHYRRLISGTTSLSKQELFAKRYYCAAKALAHVFGITGLSTTVVTACSASCAAIGFAGDCIRMGASDVMLAGGSDALSETTLAGFDGLKATCDETCAPFSKPVGLNLGEGAAFVILESYEHAVLRNAKIHAELLGFGLSNDAYHCTAPDPSGAGQALAMERALKNSGMSVSKISYINAHGTGTEANDRTETRAVKKVFGDVSSAIAMSSTKSIIGHCLGAAGSLETAASILCLEKGVVPPTAHFSTARESCTLDYVPDAGRTISPDCIMMNNNFAFGGNNASIILSTSTKHENKLLTHAKIEPVVITGIGLISSAGIGHEVFMASSNNQRTTDGMVPAFDMRTIDRRLDDKGMDASSRFALAATRLALLNAQYPEKQSSRKNLGLFCNLSAGPSSGEAEHITALLQNNFHINQVAAFPYIVPNSITGNVCKALGITGHNTTLCFGQGAGLMGLGFSLAALQNGHVDAIVNLSVDELSERIKTDVTLANESCNESTRYGEGACAFMLESEDHAKLRNAKIMGRIYAVAYATEITQSICPDDSSDLLKNTIQRALDKAKIQASDVGTICLGSKNVKDAHVVNELFPQVKKHIDVSATTGFAESSTPLFNLVYALLDTSLETGIAKKYILSVFSSDIGADCVTVSRKE